MKSIVLSSVVTALLIFSGCSSKNPDASGAVDTATNNNSAQEVAAVNTETVAAENSVISTGSSNMVNSMSESMSDMEQKLVSVYFDFDQYAVTSSMQEKLSNNMSFVQAAAAKYTIKLEGNCDEWGSDEYNFALGLKRADAVKKALVAQGINAENVTMVSYGESKPTCNDKTQECWAKNRRVDFKLLP